MMFVPVVPACVLLGVLGGPLVNFVYGHRWSEAAGPLAFLAVVGASRVALELAYDFLVSAGESMTAFPLHVLLPLSLIPTLIIAAHVGGITGVGAGHVVALTFIVLPAYAFVLRRLGVTLASIIGPLRLPLFGGLLMALTALAVLAVAPSNFLALALGGTLSSLVYVLVVGVPLWRPPPRGGGPRRGPPAGGGGARAVHPTA